MIFVSGLGGLAVPGRLGLPFAFDKDHLKNRRSPPVIPTAIGAVLYRTTEFILSRLTKFCNHTPNTSSRPNISQSDGLSCSSGSG